MLVKYFFGGGGGGGGMREMSDTFLWGLNGRYWDRTYV